MHSAHLNEHDANQGAQSTGEFLGMTGNSGWYLLGSAGLSLLLVILCWGILGLSLLLCLFVGAILCASSLTYVFALKNNRPKHYDTDFFESALVEAGLMSFSFGPKDRRQVNPFSENSGVTTEAPHVARTKSPRIPSVSAAMEKQKNVRTNVSSVFEGSAQLPVRADSNETDEAPMINRQVYEGLQEQLTSTEELLEEAIAEQGED